VSIYLKKTNINNFFIRIAIQFFVLFSLVLFLIVFGLQNNTEYESILVNISFLLLTLLPIFAIYNKKSYTDASFFFLIFFLIYQSVIPLIFYLDLVSIWKSDILVGNWQLLLKANSISIIGFFLYLLGILFASHSRLIRSKKLQIVKHSNLKFFIWYFALVSVASWLVLFFYSGMPTEVFAGQSPDGRYRGYLYGIPGHMYIVSMTFGIYIALLFYMLKNPKLNLFSLQFIMFYYALFVITAFDNSRLTLFSVPIAVFVARGLVHNRNENTKSSEQYKVLFVGSLLIVCAIFFGQYRTNQENSFLLIIDSMLWYAVNMFDSAVAYFLVLNQIPDQADFWYGKSLLSPILNRIPTFLMPDKYDHMWSTQRFVLEFYNYNQHDPRTVSRSMSFFSELYLNFSYYGIFVGMLFFGWFNEKFSRYVHSAGVSNVIIVIYVIYATNLIPYLFKSGLSASVSLLDTKLILISSGLILMLILENYKKRNY